MLGSTLLASLLYYYESYGNYQETLFSLKRERYIEAGGLEDLKSLLNFSLSDGRWKEKHRE